VIFKRNFSAWADVFSIRNKKILDVENSFSKHGIFSFGIPHLLRPQNTCNAFLLFEIKFAIEKTLFDCKEDIQKYITLFL